MVERVVESTDEIVVDSSEKSKIRVLHVDDELDLLKVAKRCLEMEGPFHVDSASSVEEGLKKMNEETYDVVVSDYQMPGKDGLQFLRELRTNRNSLPFIIFTGKGREEVAIEALNLGANQYLNKTGDPATVYCELAHGIQQAVEKNKTEEELRRFSIAVKSSLDGIIICDLNGRIIEVNDAIARTYGIIDEREILGKSFLDFLAPEELDRATEELKELLQEGGLRRREYTAITKSGKRVPTEISVTLLKDSESKPIGIVSIIRDVTDRKKAEEELKESEERYRGLFESIRDPISIYVGKEGHLIDYNTAFRELFGYTDEELKSKVFLDLVHPDDKTLVLRKYQTKYPAEDFPVVYEIKVMNKKGESIPLEISVSQYKRKGRVIGIEVVHRGLAVRKRYEESLSALNTHGRDLNMAKSIEEVYELTLDAAEKTLGFEFADILMVEGKTLRVRAHRGYLGNLSLELPLDGDKGITVRTARTGKPVIVPDISKDSAYVGVGLHMRSELAVPIKIGNRVLGILNAEREKLNAFSEKDQELLEILASHAAAAMSNLDHAQKLDALNEKLRVVGGLTRHDVRNKLSAIMGNTYLLKKRLAGDREDDKLKAIEKAVQQAVEIFDFARAYEMLGADELVYTNVEKTVSEASLLLANQNNIEVVNDCHGLTVLADSLLRQLFYNLIDNSLKYGQKTTRIRVHYEKTGQDSLKLVYEDDGVGISAAEKPKLFRESYSTGGSTGYGLYLIKKMMEVYGWTIQETGISGRRAQFTITIPKTNKHGKENYQVA